MSGFERLAARLTPTDPFEARMRIELLRTLTQQNRSVIALAPLTSASMAGTALIWVDFQIVVLWYLALLATCALAFASFQAFNRAAAEPKDAGLWTLRILASLTPYFLLWSGLVPLMWVDGNVANNAFLVVFMLAAVSASAVFFGVYLPASLLLTLPFLPLLALYEIPYSESLPWIGAVVQTVYGCSACGFAVDIQRRARAHIALQIRNEELVRELAAARERAERANEAKSVFLASMSHELRTPLTGILGYAELIARGSNGSIGSEKHGRFIAGIQASGKHLLSLINDILDLAKVEAGKREFVEEELDVAALAGDVLRFVERQAGQAGVALLVAVEGNPTLIADKRAVTQILSNLLSNAVKFTRVGGQATVFAARAGDGFCLGVEDTGEGMTEDGLKKALEPYGQTSIDKMTVEGRGTGLGLPIVKALVEAHGATFHIESRPGVGTKVWAAFPATRVAEGKVAA